MFSKESRTNTGATTSNKYQIQLRKRICCHENPKAVTVFSSSIGKFLRTPILKNICEWLLLKISTSVTNLPKGDKSLISDFFYPFKPFSILNFSMAEWFCHVTCFTKVCLLLQGRRESESGDRGLGEGRKMFFQVKSENINVLQHKQQTYFKMQEQVYIGYGNHGNFWIILVIWT